MVKVLWAQLGLKRLCPLALYVEAGRNITFTEARGEQQIAIEAKNGIFYILFDVLSNKTMLN